jgi:transposase
MQKPQQNIERAYDILRTENVNPLDAIFAPNSVAVIGASEKLGSVGRTLLWNLISNPFGGTVYPVNPKHHSVLGIRAYPTISDIPEQVDLAVIATPASTVPNIIGDCVNAGIKGVIIISAGFKESGALGVDLEQQILTQAHRSKIRIIGPNCLGLMIPRTGLNATFASAMARPGNVAFISQSGALCTAILDWSFQENVGFSAFVSIGSMLDVGWGDLIYYLSDDPHTQSIVIYMESIGDARSFLSAAREVALTKPIIVIKAGRTEAAAKAAISHTGASNITSLQGKPILASWMGGANVTSGEMILNHNGIPTYPYPDEAARTFTYMWRSSYNLQGIYETPILGNRKLGIGDGYAVVKQIIDIASFKLHQNHRHIIKDLSFAEKPVFLEINRRQFKCNICKKPFSEDFDFAKKKRTYTQRLAKKIIQDVLENDIHSVASKGIVTTEEIERMLKDASEQLLNIKPVNLKRLGIDEISLTKGKGNYCAVLIDLDTSKLIAILNGRTIEVVKEVVVGWGTEILEQIEEVSIDLWQSYKNLVTELMPLAQVVADRFHIMVQINKELDSQRKKEKRKVEESIKNAKTLSEKTSHEKVLEGLNKSKYVLLKNESDLNIEQMNKLVQVKAVSSTLKEMHEFKEKIRTIFNKTDNWYPAVFKLGMWLSKAKTYFPRSNNTFIRWFDEIIAYFDNGTTSGVFEGINNKLKLIKRSAYGFRNFENFRVRCLLNWHFN